MRGVLGQPVLPTEVRPDSVVSAQRFVRRSEMPLELKKQWDVDALPAYQALFGITKQNIPNGLRGGWPHPFTLG